MMNRWTLTSSKKSVGLVNETLNARKRKKFGTQKWKVKANRYTKRLCGKWPPSSVARVADCRLMRGFHLHVSVPPFPLRCCPLQKYVRITFIRKNSVMPGFEHHVFTLLLVTIGVSGAIEMSCYTYTYVVLYVSVPFSRYRSHCRTAVAVPLCRTVPCPYRPFSWGL